MNAAIRIPPIPQKVAALVARVEGQVVPVTAAAPGMVESVLVSSGQYVEKGDVLVRMDARNTLRRLKAAAANLDAALIDALEPPFEPQALMHRMVLARITTRISPDVHAARAEYLRARIEHMNAEVRAPVAGRVARVGVRVREAVARSQPMISIVQSDDLWIVARFDPEEMQWIRAGQRAAVHAEGRVFAARVETVTSPDEPVLLEFVDYAVSPAAVIQAGARAAVIVEVNS